jgi:carbamoyl-phosphate synthase large subunit
MIQVVRTRPSGCAYLMSKENARLGGIILTLLNVLMTAASRRVALVQGFRRALHELGGGSVTVTDVNPLSPAVYFADRAYRVPLATDPTYMDVVLAICVAERVGLVVPTIDDELMPFALAKPAFEAAGARVAVSAATTIGICDDKYQTCKALQGHGIAAASSWLPGELPATPEFPLFIKPRIGRGSVGAHRATNARELAFFLDYVASPVVQEYLDGPEFTIDVLCDFAGRPLSIVPRERVLARAGVSDRGRTSNDPRLMALAESCVAALPCAGAINIQCRIVNGRPVVFEINPRFSGGIPLTIHAGADFPRMLVQLGLGTEVAPAIGAFRDNVWMTNYEASVFLGTPDITLDPLPSPDSVEETV